MSAATLSHEMDVEGQTLRKNCDFEVSISTLSHEMDVERYLIKRTKSPLQKFIKYIPININQHSFFWTCDFYIGTWNFWSSNTFPRSSHDVPGASEEHEASGRGRGTGWDCSVPVEIDCFSIGCTKDTRKGVLLFALDVKMTNLETGCNVNRYLSCLKCCFRELTAWRFTTHICVFKCM